MAFVNDQVAVIADQVFDDTFAHQTLNHGDIQLAIGLLFASADSTYLLALKIKKRRQTLNPLIHQLSPVNEH